MNVESLIIETSRKCNIKCEHCLRGTAQRKVLDFEKLSVLLSKIDYIGTLTIGGGELSLAKRQLEELSHTFRYSGIKVGNLFVVTNGKLTPQWLLDWYINFTLNICTENDIAGFTFSFDKWHDHQLNNEQKRKRLHHYHYAQEYIEMQTGKEQVSKHSNERWNENGIIAMGRAEDWGNKFLQPQTIIIEENYIETNIYWTVDGLLFSDCNLSYKEMTKKSKYYVTNWKELKNSDLAFFVNQYNEKL